MRDRGGRTRLLLWGAAALVFVLGCVTGAALDGVYRLKAGGPPCGERGHGRRDRGRMFEEMRRDLDLTPEQSERVRAILEETRGDYRALRAEGRPRFEAIRQGARDRIRALLNEEQRRRFDARVAERDARRRGGDDEEDR